MLDFCLCMYTAILGTTLCSNVYAGLTGIIRRWWRNYIKPVSRLCHNFADVLCNLISNARKHILWVMPTTFHLNLRNDHGLQCLQALAFFIVVFFLVKRFK